MDGHICSKLSILKIAWDGELKGFHCVYRSPSSGKTQNIHDWQIHEICDYDLPIVIYYINHQIREILLFKRNAIIFRKGKSLQVGGLL